MMLHQSLKAMDYSTDLSCIWQYNYCQMNLAWEQVAYMCCFHSGALHKWCYKNGHVLIALCWGSDMIVLIFQPKTPMFTSIRTWPVQEYSCLDIRRWVVFVPMAIIQKILDDMLHSVTWHRLQDCLHSCLQHTVFNACSNLLIGNVFNVSNLSHNLHRSVCVFKIREWSLQ